MNRVFAAVLAATLIVFSLPGAASQVNWQFTATVNNGNLNGFFFPFAVAPGDPVTIDLSLATDTPCATCSSTVNLYNDPLTALSFTAKGKTFAFPISSSDLFLVKNRPPLAGAPPPGGKYFSNQFDLNVFGFHGPGSSSDINYEAVLVLQNAALMPPVPGINDVNLANLAPPDPAAFANSILGDDTNFWDVQGATPDGGFNNFGGQTLTSSVAAAPEFDAASTGAALTLLLGTLVVLRSRRGRRTA
jgi:hypothetical protein